MSLQSHFEFLFVGRDEGSFLENYSYDLTQEHGAQGGQLFIALEIQNNPADAEVIGETIADTLRRVFFTNIDHEPYERLEDALKAVNKVIARFKEQRVSGFIGTIHVVVGAICGNELFLSKTGDAEAYLIRSKFVSVITEGLNDDVNPEEGPFVNIASGTIEKNDIVLFTTAKILRYVSQAELAKVLSPNNMSQSLHELRDVLEPEILTKIGVVGMAIAEREVVANEVSGNVEVHEEVLRSGYDIDPEDSREAIKSVFNSLWDKAQDAVKSVAEGTKSVSGVVTKTEKTKKDKILLGLIGVILVLSMGIWYTKSQSIRAEERLVMDQQLDDAAVLISDAETKGYDKNVANELLRQAEQKVVEVRNAGQHRNKANEMLERIQSVKRMIDNITFVDDPQNYVFADLTSKRPNVSALGLIGTDDVIYAFEYNALYEIIAGQLQDPKTIDDTETVTTGASFDDQDALVFLTTSGKVIEYIEDRFEFADAQDGAFRKGVAVEDYSNRIYILDDIENQVWRYTYSGRSEVFTTPDAYLANGDASNGVDLAIDQSVYVLKGDGQILRYFGGEVQDFIVRKQPFDLIDAPTKIFTESEMNEMFILEPSKNRVVVLLKDEQNGGAVYNSQIVIENSDELRDIYFDKDDRKLYVLSQTKVYSFDI